MCVRGKNHSILFNGFSTDSANFLRDPLINCQFRVKPIDFEATNFSDTVELYRLNSRFVIPKSHYDGGKTANSYGETCLADFST